MSNMDTGFTLTPCHCKKEGFWLNLVTSVSYLFCISKHSGDPM